MQTIELGKGKVLITSLFHEGKYCVIMRQTDEQHYAGEKNTMPHELFVPRDTDILISFDNVQSALVLSNVLADLELRIVGKAVVNG
jgi:hypothetical protein